MTSLEKFRLYEMKKEELLETATSCEEYEEGIRKICEELKI